MIYADQNSSSPLSKKVSMYLAERVLNGPFANPNSIHSLGRKMNFGLHKCRLSCAKALGARPEQIIFNSGSSEGISHVFHSILNYREDSKKIIITSGLEHAVVVEACSYYSKKGFITYHIDTDETGLVNVSQLNELLKKYSDEVALVCLMAANNETGVIQPYKEISNLCKNFDVKYLCDTTQYIGKSDFNFLDSGIDYAVVSGHKVGAIIGSGILICKDIENLNSMIFGGSIQESGKRGGTQGYIGAETLAIALSEIDEKRVHFERVKSLRVNFENNIKTRFPEVVIIGDKSNRLYSTTLISYPGIHGQAVQIELESNDIFVTTSSACSDNEPVTSRVLKAMKIGDKVGRGIIRISLCTNATEIDYKTIESALINAYSKLAKIHSY